jgi:hypothetical protein
MPAPTITALPTAPSRSDAPATFVTEAEAFVEALEGLPTEINAFGSYLDGLGLDGTSWKGVVRVATTVAGTLATGFENGDTVDGVVLATGDRILIKNQAAAAENGIYVVAASGVPTRATDCDTGAELLGLAVIVAEGTVNADTLWYCTTNATITVGSTSLTFTQFVSAAGGLNTQTDSYTLALSDAYKLVSMNKATANNLTVPPNSSVAFTVGTRIDVGQYGAGQTTIVAGSGVTIRSAGGKLKLSGQYSGGTLQKIAADEWWLFGDITT